MIKVGIECESLEGEAWGIGRILEKLLSEIDRRPELKNEFKFFLYFKSKIPTHPYLDNPIFVKKIAGLPIPFFPVSYSLYYYIFLPVRLWFERLDIMYFPAYMLPIIFKGKSLVTLTPDMYYEAYQGTLPFRYRLAYKVFGTWAARHATKIAVVSRSSIREVSRLFKIRPARIAVIPNGIDVPLAKNTYGFENENYIFYLGQAFPRRHLKETMLAFEKIAHEFPDLKFYAIGADRYNPPLLEKLKNEINKRLGREAIIRGEHIPQDKLSAFYEHAKACIYVSSKEGFGLPPLEGLSRGAVPIVAHDEITEELFGEHAFYVPEPISIDSIAEAMRQALTNKEKHEKIQEAALEITSRYTWRAHTDKFLETVRSIKRSQS